MIDISSLSQTFNVRKLDDKDIDKILFLMEGNKIYFHHCPPKPSIKTVLDDLKALPKNKDYIDKYYLGYFVGNTLVAVLDLIDHYPTNKSVFIGFFMVDFKFQHQKIGSEIIDELKKYFKESQYKEIRLGYVKTNPQSASFWLKNGFSLNGTIVKTEMYDILVNTFVLNTNM